MIASNDNLVFVRQLCHRLVELYNLLLRSHAGKIASVNQYIAIRNPIDNVFQSVMRIANTDKFHFKSSGICFTSTPRLLRISNPCDGLVIVPPETPFT
jgi:hypothetical protein